MGPLTALIPMPREVKLAGSTYLIGEARLCDLAELQALLNDLAEDPLELLEEVLADENTEARHSSLIAMFNDAKRCILYHGIEGTAYFTRHPEGICRLLWVAIKRYQPALTLPECATITSKVTRKEFSRFYRVFHGTDPLKLLSKLLLGGEESSKDRDPNTWMEAIDELARDRGWTYEYIYSLTLTEWISARTHGKPSPPGRRLQPGEDKTAVMLEWMQKFHHKVSE